MTTMALVDPITSVMLHPLDPKLLKWTCPCPCLNLKHSNVKFWDREIICSNEKSKRQNQMVLEGYDDSPLLSISEFSLYRANGQTHQPLP